MDPHFTEYLAAVAGMHDVYGEAGDDRPTDFHEVSATESGDVAATVPVSMPHGIQGHWDCEPSEDFAGSGVWI